MPQAAPGGLFHGGVLGNILVAGNHIHEPAAKADGAVGDGIERVITAPPHEIAGLELRAALPDDAAVRAENDFVAEEVAKFPDRLMGFCGVNPLYPGATEELDRCLDLDGMVGIASMAGPTLMLFICA